MTTCVLFKHDADEPVEVRLDVPILHSLRKEIGCRLVAGYPLDAEFCLMYDDEGALNENRERPNRCLRKFFPAGFDSFHGNVILYKETEEEESDTTLDDLKDLQQKIIANEKNRSEFYGLQ